MFRGSFDLAEGNFLIVASRFNEFVVDKLVEGAKGGFDMVANPKITYDVAYCPGAAELPLLAKAGAQTSRYDAIVALGAVIRGETSHYDVVVNVTTSGLAKVSQDYSIPVLMGILTTDTVEQAMNRAGVKGGNKGFEAALGAIEMVSVLKKLAK
ncbi:MAG: 6,7-dimethyl-8-ribityllumazine synthase [Actinomycetota bacterium]|nr:6,7-dimethyl-8-ribityllumazine synthase [Actinomycetota bacterium]